MITRYGQQVNPLAAAAGNNATAEGFQTSANGQYSHAEGFASQSGGQYSHAEGTTTSAAGIASHAEGSGSSAAGAYSHAQGRSTVAGKFGQHAFSSIVPGNLASSLCQVSDYTVGTQWAAFPGDQRDLALTGDASVTLTGTNTSQIVIPLKSLFLVKFDIVARFVDTASPANASGACWSGSVLAGRGNSTGTSCFTSAGAQQNNTGTITLTPTYSFDSATATNIRLNYAPVGTDANNNYLRFFMSSINGSNNYIVFGGIRCMELATTV